MKKRQIKKAMQSIPKSVTKNCELKLLDRIPFPLSGTTIREKKRLSMMYCSHNMAAGKWNNDDKYVKIITIQLQRIHTKTIVYYNL